MSDAPQLLRRVLALAILAALILAVTGFAVLPALDRAREIEEDLAHNRALIERLSRSISNRGAYEAEIAEVERRIAESGLYIRAATDPLAAAAMQEHVKRAVTRHGGELRSLQALSGEAEDGLSRVGLRVVMSGANATLVRVLHALETGEPYLFVENLQINSSAHRRRLRKADAAETLSVTFDIHGYLPPGVEG